MLREMSFGYFAAEQTKLAVATVESVTSALVPGRQRMIVSTVSFTLEKGLQGRWKKKFQARMLGGTVGDLKMETEDTPVPNPGKQVLVVPHPLATLPDNVSIMSTGRERPTLTDWTNARRELLKVRERVQEARKRPRKGSAVEFEHPLLRRDLREFVADSDDPKWGDTYPTNALIEVWDNTADLGAETAHQAVLRAINTWNHSGADFSIRHVDRAGGLAASSTDTRNIIRWSPGPAANPNALATATWRYYVSTDELIECDIQFWDNWDWSTDPGGTEFDVESVAAHELGHLIGLAHGAAGDVMAPAIGQGTRLRALSANDITAIQALYGQRPVGDWIVYRWWNGKDHFYATHVHSELAPDVGYAYEGAPFRLYAPGTADTTRLFRWYRRGVGDHFYCTDPNGELAPAVGYRYEGSIGNIATTQIAGSVPLYRWYNSGTGDHFYTTDPNGELAPVGGYVPEGITGYVRQ